MEQQARADDAVLAKHERRSDEISVLSTTIQVAFPPEWHSLARPDHFWIQWRLRAALRQVRDVGLPLDRPLRALDVGSGTGVLRAGIEERTAWTVDLADLDMAALERAGPGRGRRLRYDVTDMDPALVRSYDVVVAFDVLEHVEPTAPFVHALVAHLRTGGYLLVNVPAIQSLYSEYDRAAGHHRRYDRRTLCDEFMGAEMEIRDVRYWGAALVPLLVVRTALLRGEAPSEDTIRRGFAPPGPAAHAALRALMHLETVVARRPPLGSSLLLAGRKPAASSA